MVCVRAGMPVLLQSNGSGIVVMKWEDSVQTASGTNGRTRL